MRNLIIALLLPLALAACGAEPTWAPEAEVQQARVAYPGPKYISLVTVISTSTGSGGHSGLIINGSERVIFDPAGTFKHPNMPERNDVIFGLTDQRLEVYLDYHARETFYVVTQDKVVSPETAELILARAKAYGAVPKAHCAQSISTILSGVPGFESLPKTYYPVKLKDAFAQLGGVTEKKIYDDDADDNRYVLYIDPQTGKPFE